MADALLPQDPEQIGPYRLVGRLGAGGMGEVFLANTPGGRPVAIKVIRREFAEDPEFRMRFAREVAAAQAVASLYTAPVIDAEVNGTVPWLATAYVAGPSLAQVVAEHGPLSINSLQMLAAGLAEGLEAVHRSGLIHRDLKPSNVLLAEDGPRIIDFGLAHAFENTTLTGVGTFVGTPAYMSPEQVHGHVGTASDVFSLGLLLAYAATGTTPFGEGPFEAILYRILHEDPDLSKVPHELRPLIARCLAKDPSERPSPAQILAEMGGFGSTQGWIPAGVRPAGEPGTRHSGTVTPLSLSPLPPGDAAKAHSGASRPLATAFFSRLKDVRARADVSSLLRGRAVARPGRDRPQAGFNWVHCLLHAAAAFFQHFIAHWLDRPRVRRPSPVAVLAEPQGDGGRMDGLPGTGFTMPASGAPHADAGAVPGQSGSPPRGGSPPSPPTSNGSPDPEEPDSEENGLLLADPDCRQQGATLHLRPRGSPNVEEHEPGTGYPGTPSEAGDPDSIADRPGFARALRQARASAGLTSRQVAAATGLPLSAVSAYFGGRRVPSEPSKLLAILAACGVRASSAAKWEAALLRVRETPCASRSDGARPGHSPANWVGDFPASILWLSSDYPASAVDLLGRSGAKSEAIPEVMAALAAKHHEGMLADLELQHEEERLAVRRAELAMRNRHDAEIILAKAGIFSHKIRASQVSPVSADRIPQAGTPEISARFSAPPPGQPAPAHKVEYHQHIATSNATVVQGQHSSVNNVGVDARQVIELIERHGGSDVQPLKAAVRELQSADASAEKRSFARKNILKFLVQLADSGKEVAASVIVKYLATLSGLPS